MCSGESSGEFCVNVCKVAIERCFVEKLFCIFVQGSWFYFKWDWGLVACSEWIIASFHRGFWSMWSTGALCDSNSFLSQTIREWNELVISIWQASLYSVFWKALLDFIRPTVNSTFGTNDASDLKLLTHIFALVSAIWKNVNLNIIFKIYLSHCALVPLKQKTSITFLCVAKFFLINEICFLMILIQLAQRF